MFLMRVSLPDRPGSLGAVAAALGTAGADISSIEIVQKSDGIAVDDFILALPQGQLPESVVVACQGLPNVRVEWISRYPGGANLQSDLEALERMMADPAHAAETLVAQAPVVFRAQWAILVERCVGSAPGAVTFSTPHAPDLSPESLSHLQPFDDTHVTDLEPGWAPGWQDSTVVVAPLTDDRAIAIGRIGGPAFLGSEVARLRLLATLAH
ncbi:hypothetical protein JOE57_000252 [Microlunatus panaciterrae]|uniref:ACT domain-containing protein n=2 Tax=Microlunatus panaciterrae TaxID=400768 RepID=A0ABS2REA2_9ACTN|nr:hypothetical protein [Microlunatus panaciterrae]